MESHLVKTQLYNTNDLGDAIHCQQNVLSFVYNMYRLKHGFEHHMCSTCTVVTSVRGPQLARDLCGCVRLQAMDDYEFPI